LLPLRFEACLVEHGIDRIAIDESFTQITGDLSKEDQANLTASRGES
jgi:ABC-type phosphate transport system auxiliary subunit